MEDLKGLSEEVQNSSRRVDLEGVLTEREGVLNVNGAHLCELLAYGLPHKGYNRRKYGRVRITVERIEE